MKVNLFGYVTHSANPILRREPRKSRKVESVQRGFLVGSISDGINVLFVGHIHLFHLLYSLGTLLVFKCRSLVRRG